MRGAHYQASAFGCERGKQHQREKCVQTEVSETTAFSDWALLQAHNTAEHVVM